MWGEMTWAIIYNFAVKSIFNWLCVCVPFRNWIRIGVEARTANSVQCRKRRTQCVMASAITTNRIAGPMHWIATQYREQLKGARKYRFILPFGGYKTNEMFLMYLSHCSPVVLFIFCVSVARRNSASFINTTKWFLPPTIRPLSGYFYSICSWY